MKKKGFTLIELLAVIVILAIIALILVPVISNVIDSSRKAAFRESVNGIIDSGGSYLQEYILKYNNELNDFPVEFSCDGTKCGNGEFTLTFKGNVPKSGNIIIQKDGILAEYITDGKYCAYGYKWNLVVENSCGDVDVTKPTITGTQNGKVITLTMTDNESGIDSYCATNTDSTEGCNWVVPSNASSEEYEIAAAGTKYFFTKDKKGNISDSINFTTTTADYCKYAVSTPYEEYDYTGGMQTFTVPSGCGGTYKLEVWGAQGGAITASGTWDGYTRYYTSYGGKGGYATGNIELTSGQTIYIYIGGQAGTRSSVHGCESVSGGAAGYNGGGNTSSCASGSGGGATHIATTDRGTLPNYNSYKDDVIIVAGGGGGGAYIARGGDNIGNTGGTGGGTTGGKGGFRSGLQVSNDTGGSQTEGGRGGGGNGSFGQGAASSSGGAGGGGWYGGGAGGSYNGSVAGSGGSGYIGGVTDGSMSNGERSGNGYAKITYIETGYIITFDAQGGNVSTPTKTIYAGNQVIGEMPIPTRSGYIFWGWYLDNEYRVMATPETTVVDDMILYARWTQENYVTLEYTGAMQSVYILNSGNYKLEVWGAQGSSNSGGDGTYGGGAGGYAYGNTTLTAGDTLKVAIGGSGGFNGGGNVSDGGWARGGNGGGATHIAKNVGNYTTLSSYGNADTADDYVYLVAGGGGGAGEIGGGAGGGTTGSYGYDRGCGQAAPGSQTSGYRFGQGGPGSIQYGDGNAVRSGGGGGAGWYGGNGGYTCNGYWAGGGGGGAGWIGGVTDGGMTNGQRSGNGLARITYLGN